MIKNSIKARSKLFEIVKVADDKSRTTLSSFVLEQEDICNILEAEQDYRISKYIDSRGNSCKYNPRTKTLSWSLSNSRYSSWHCLYLDVSIVGLRKKYVCMMLEQSSEELDIVVCTP